ncbi:hypothetical protein FQN57_006959 [Myotisia sp. PD_48]|nr:hypothetical protein FQN57_006959 [Myotisia sp. PD_48]
MVHLSEPFSSIPRQEFLLGPSPIHHLPRMTSDLGGKVQIYAKREDVSSGLAYGGNKTRKLEYLVADALANGCDTLVSIGGIQSNHTRQVAAVSARMGLRCALVQEDWVPWTDSGYEKVGNIQLSRLLGADIRVDKHTTFGIQHKDTLKALMAEYEAKGLKPYYIPAGASDHPLGGLGFARWALEVREQEKTMGITFSHVVVCAVTGSTMAGIVAGFKLIEKLYPDEPRKTILGIDASAKPEETRDQVLRIARSTAEKIGLKAEDITAEDILLDERYHAGTYGVPDKQTWDAIEYGARMDAFITDPVYEGKSLAGMIDMIRKGEFGSGNILYAHLGGQLALNAYSELGHVA